MKKSRKKKTSIFFISLIALILFFYLQNNSIVTTESMFRSKNIPMNFNNYKIVQLSDLHGKEFGKNQRTLVRKVENEKPNLIVFTGDLIDSNKYVDKHSITLMKELVKIAPVFFVTGNHEWWSGKYDSLEGKLKDAGVKVLRNETVEIERKGKTIQLIGIDDPAKKTEYLNEIQMTEENIKSSMKEFENRSEFKILLSHRPEMISLYANYGFDLVFSGHAHGGQIRIPFVGGVVAPNQGFLPKYTAGEYKLKNTTMIVNRGLGNSIIPLRIFNRPEVVVVTLKSK